MNTENSKTNEPNRFMYQLTNKINLKSPNKNMALTNLSIYYTWKTLNLDITIINLKYMLQLGLINLIYLIDLPLFLIFMIILNTLSKNMKLFQIILLY